MLRSAAVLRGIGEKNGRADPIINKFSGFHNWSTGD